MSQVHRLREEEMEVPDDLADILEAFVASQQYGGEDPPPPEPTHHRHQLLNPDFWFFAGGTVFMFLPFTSFVTGYSFEPLLAAGLFCNACGIVANLTRDRQAVYVHEIRKRFAINLRFPRWMGFGYVPTTKPLFEEVRW